MSPMHLLAPEEKKQTIRKRRVTVCVKKLSNIRAGSGSDQALHAVVVKKRKKKRVSDNQTATPAIAKSKSAMANSGKTYSNDNINEAIGT